MTFVLALVAAGLVAVDAWLFADDGDFKAGSCSAAPALAVACFAAPDGCVLSVERPLCQAGSSAATPARAASVRRAAPMGPPWWSTASRFCWVGRWTGFFAEREPQFRQAMADMGHQFWTSDGKLGMIGQGRNVVALIAVVFVVASWRRLVPAVCGCALAAWACCPLSAFWAITSNWRSATVLSLSRSRRSGWNDYNRYIESYYIGWFLMALACLMIALQPQLETVSKVNGPTAAFTTSRYAPKRPLAAQGIVLLLAVAMLVRQNQIVLPQLSVLGFADSEFADRKQSSCRGRATSASNLQPDDRVFYVSQGDNGEGWFSAVFDFYPVLVDYSGIMSDNERAVAVTFGLPELQARRGRKSNLLSRFHGR